MSDIAKTVLNAPFKRQQATREKYSASIFHRIAKHSALSSSALKEIADPSLITSTKQENW